MVLRSALFAHLGGVGGNDSVGDRKEDVKDIDRLRVRSKLKISAVETAAIKSKPACAG
jgi:hypothetical protein